MNRTEQNRIVLLEGTFKDLLVQLLVHFRANQILKHIIEGVVQMLIKH